MFATERDEAESKNRHLVQKLFLKATSQQPPSP
jgi:hypothetical protein